MAASTTPREPTPSTIADPDEDTLGPAMKACTPLQRRFVIAYLDLGGKDATRALAMAGSTAATREGLRVSAYNLMHHDKIMMALEEETRHRFRTNAVLAASTMAELAASAVKESVRLKAAEALADRTGFHRVSEKRLHVTDNSKTDTALIQRLKDLLAENPDNIKMVPDQLRPLLIEAPKEKPIDAEFTEVDEIDKMAEEIDEIDLIAKEANNA